MNTPKTLPSTELSTPNRLLPMVLAIEPKSRLPPPMPSRIPWRVSDWWKFVLTKLSAESSRSGMRETSCESWSTSSEPKATTNRTTKSRNASITMMVARPRFMC